MNDRVGEWKSNFSDDELNEYLRLRKVSDKSEPTMRCMKRLTALLIFYGKVRWVDPYKVDALYILQDASWCARLDAIFWHVPCTNPVHDFRVPSSNVCVSDQTKSQGKSLELSEILREKLCHVKGKLNYYDKAVYFWIHYLCN